MTMRDRRLYYIENMEKIRLSAAKRRSMMIHTPEPINSPEGLITAQRAAYLAGVHKQTIIEWARLGYFPFFKYKNRYYFREKDVLNHERQRTSHYERGM